MKTLLAGIVALTIVLGTYYVVEKPDLNNVVPADLFESDAKKIERLNSKINKLKDKNEEQLKILSQYILSILQRTTNQLIQGIIIGDCQNMLLICQVENSRKENTFLLKQLECKQNSCKQAPVSEPALDCTKQVYMQCLKSRGL